MANGQFQSADIMGEINRGLQFRQQQELRPLEIAAAKQQLQQGEQSNQFAQTQNRALEQQIDQRTDDQKNQSLFNTALQVSQASDADIIPLLEANVLKVQSMGGNADESMRALELAKTGDLTKVREGANNLIDIGVRQGDIKAPGGKKSSGQVEFESLISGFSDEDKVKARRVKAGLTPRMVGSATQTIANLGNAATVADVEAVMAGAKEVGKLKGQQQLKPEVEAAVIASVGQAKASVKALAENKSNSKTLGVYNTAMGNLTKALDGTITGPFIGLTPALTSNAQIADGAISMMIPLMKDVFRGAGEGSFSDGDQKVLIDLIPTRSDTPEARASRISMIDSIIRSKLSNPSAGEGELSAAELAELQQLRSELGQQ